MNKTALFLPLLIGLAALASAAFAGSPHLEGSTVSQKELELGAIQRQKALERLALELSREPKVAAARERARQNFRQDPNAATVDGAASLQDAADQHFWGALHLATNLDPYHPQIPVLFMYAHETDGQAYPSSLHGGLENPDNLYRIVPIAPDATYEIRGLRHNPGPTQVFYELLDAVPGIGGLGEQLVHLHDQNLTIGPDGTFTISIDAQPANGRPNHMQILPETRTLLVRDALSDWSTQNPDTLHVVRTGGPDRAPRSRAELIEDAAELVYGYAKFWNDFRAGFVAKHKLKVNAFDPPMARTGGWGFIINTHFEIEADEAFVFTADPGAFPYHSVLIGNHWWITLDSARRPGAYNTSQAARNADGTITYVIARQDPGAPNWLDTGGLGTGIIQIRWQGGGPDQTPPAIRNIGVVKLSALKQALPPETRWIDPAERARQLERRHATYIRRMQAP